MLPVKGGRKTVPIVCCHRPKFLGCKARQGRSVRQHCDSEQQGGRIFGAPDSPQGQGVEVPRTQTLSIRCSPVQDVFCGGRGDVEPGCSSPLPDTAWGSSRRPQRQRARPRQCQTAWPLDDRSKSTTVHKNWKDPTDDQQVVSRTSGLLSLVSSQHGARYERFGFPKDAVTSLGWPEVFSMRSMPPKFCLELFAGTARVTKCLLKKGLLPFPIDICIDPRQNVLHVHVGHTLLHLIQGGHIRCLWVGIPCTSFTRARKHDGLGPGPIRSEHHVCGLPI